MQKPARAASSLTDDELVLVSELGTLTSNKQTGYMALFIAIVIALPLCTEASIWFILYLSTHEVILKSTHSDSVLSNWVITLYTWSGKLYQNKQNCFSSLYTEASIWFILYLCTFEAILKSTHSDSVLYYLTEWCVYTWSGELYTKRKKTAYFTWFSYVKAP